MSRVFSCLFMFLLLLICVPVEVKAYTDPGSGALIWQMLAAGFFGTMFYLRRIIGWFRSKGDRKPE